VVEKYKTLYDSRNELIRENISERKRERERERERESEQDFRGIMRCVICVIY